MTRLSIPAGKMEISGPKPFRVEYPYGLPGDSFRKLAPEGKATCVAYHRGVDPRQLAEIPNGNELRYGPGDLLYETLKESMLEKGFVGGNGQRLIIHVDDERVWIAEGNHRLAIALEVGVQEVEIEIRYLGRADEDFLLIPFDCEDPEIRVIAD